MEILDYIINEDTKDFKCYDELKKLMKNNECFRNIVIQGIKEGKIRGFSNELWKKLDKQNIRSKGVNSFVEVFKDGFNIGYCTVAAKQVSYSLSDCYLCGGTVEFLIGTPNSPDGSHTWIEYENEIIDTTLMLIMNKEYAYKLKYNEENRYNPNFDPVYRAAKDFTNDSNLNIRR